MKYSIIKIKEFPLKEKREKKGISGRKFAKMVDVDYAHLHRLERGMYVEKQETAERIMKVLKSYKPNTKTK